MNNSESRKYVEEFNARMIGADESAVREMYEMETAAWRNASEADIDTYAATSQIAQETLTIFDRLERIEELQDQVNESAMIIERLSRQFNSAGYEGQ